jgi:pSer/pThr/pTyr-binding forkhead associated (FHA) protein
MALDHARAEKPPLPNYVLTIESGPLQGGRFAVTLPCTIGRGDCDLILDDRLTSRRHAEIKMLGDQLVIVDLASTNGTMVNGEKVTMQSLIPNDLISIGPNNLRITRS